MTVHASGVVSQHVHACDTSRVPSLFDNHHARQLLTPPYGGPDRLKVPDHRAFIIAN